MRQLPAFEPNAVLTSRAQRIGWIASAAYLLLIGFAPLLGGPRYEAALVAGLLVPSIAALAAVFDGLGGERTWSPLDALLGGLLGGFGHALIVLAVGLIHGVRQGFCEPDRGFILLALGPGVGAVLGGLWGALGGLLLPGRRRRVLGAVLWALAMPLGAALVSVVRFVTSPMVFAFDPFVGYFAGPLYEVVDIPVDRLLTYRAGSLATVLATLAASTLVERVPRAPNRDEKAGAPSFTLRRPLDRRALVAAGLFAALSAGLALGGEQLGHFTTTASIRAALGGELSYGRCDVVYADTLPRPDVVRLARECDAHLAQLERYFEIQGSARVTVMLFASAEQKGRLMGAASTYIAKPWRREVYLQPAGYPHPVLGHELAHVVAGAFGAGPFRVAGPLGGWIPDPGRIEGVAVASAPRDDGDIALEEWAAAMRQVKLLPPLGRVFRLSFLGESSARAYTVAGAFMAWLREQEGPEVVRRWYGGESLLDLTGHDLSAWEARWLARLDSIELPETLLHEASARFERPAIFGRHCPHLVDRLAARAHQWLAVRDTTQARQALERLLELEPNHGAALLLPACTLREGHTEAALDAYRALGSEPSRTSIERARAWEGAGDVAFSLGQDMVAFDAYTTALGMTVGEHARRTLEVKRWALRAGATPRRAIQLLLIGPATTGPQWDVAAPALGQWMAEGPHPAMARYLIGKNLFARGHFFEAAAFLEGALDGSEELPLSSVRTEALRSAFLARCALSDPAGAQRVYDLLVEQKLTLGQRQGAARIAERCGVEPGLIAPHPGDSGR